MQVVFRVDASHTIGSGHVIRCLTLATALRDHGAECRFICRPHPGHFAAHIQAQRFDVHLLPEPSGRTSHPSDPVPHAHWLGCDWSEDAEQMQAQLEAVRPDWLIVDHYALDERWELALQPYYDRLMVIDDLADRQHAAHLLLDQNLFVDQAARYEGRLPPECKRLQGPQYALLQSSYGALHQKAQPRELPVQTLFVFFGGADHHNLTGLTLSALKELNPADVHVDVVVSQSSPHYDAIHTQVASQKNVSLHSDLPTLAPLMIRADLAIGAGGTTSWERLCLGLPALVITVAENQRPVTKDLHALGLVRWMGHVDEIQEDRLAREIQSALAMDIQEWSAHCLQECAGDGTQKVVNELVEASKAEHPQSGVKE